MSYGGPRLWFVDLTGHPDVRHPVIPSSAHGVARIGLAKPSSANTDRALPDSGRGRYWVRAHGAAAALEAARRLRG